MTMPSPLTLARPAAGFVLKASRVSPLLGQRLTARMERFLLVGPDHAPLLHAAEAFARHRYGGTPVVASFGGEGALRTREQFKATLALRCNATDHCGHVLVLCHIDKAPAGLTGTIEGILSFGRVPVSGVSLMDLRPFDVFVTVAGTLDDVPASIRQRVLRPAFSPEEPVSAPPSAPASTGWQTDALPTSP